MLVTDVLAVLLGVVGIAFVAMWLSPLEAQTLNVGHLLGLDEPGPRVSTFVVGVGACALAVLIGLGGRTRRNRG